MQQNNNDNNITSKYMGYSWAIVKNLIILAVVWSIFGIARSNFETIVFAFLILIYSTISWSISQQGLDRVSQFIALSGEFHRLKKLLKDESDDIERDMEDIKEVNNKLKKFEGKRWVDSIFTIIIILIALCHIANVLL